MSKYIKLERAELALGSMSMYHGRIFVEDALAKIADLPTIDIVHCGECKYWYGESEKYEDREYKKCQNGGMYQSADHYCAWGERKDNE